VLINNAGVLAFASIISGKFALLKRDMEVNYFGTLSVISLFTPILEKNGNAAIVNILSMVSLASMAGIGGYSASKAALFSATQAMRAELKAKNISVQGVFPGLIDTDMAKGVDMPKASEELTAENIIVGIANGQEDIFPDPMSAQLIQLWAKDPKELERQFAVM
jgi:short-subunit dehydrogenase